MFFSNRKLESEFNQKILNREATEEFELWYKQLDEESTDWVNCLIDSLYDVESELAQINKISILYKITVLTLLFSIVISTIFNR